MNFTRHTLLLLIILLAGCASNNKSSDNKEVKEKRDSVVKQEFVSDEYSLSASYPPEWKHDIFKSVNKQTVINIFPEARADSLELPLGIHEKADLSYISIFPNGFGTELPSGKSRSIEMNSLKPLTFEINKRESRVFLLDNEQEWGFFIVPASPPDGWSSYGFIFAQAAVNNFSIKCYDEKAGQELKMTECDPLTGDSVVRYGVVVREDMQILQGILNSFQFEKTDKDQQAVWGDDAGGIKVTTPQSGSVITSPLEITGKARGSWFFEALIEIELHKDGNILAKTSGKAEGNWMTQDYVEFTAILTFPEVKETGEAELLFRSSNPSGKKSMDKSFGIPVTLGN